MYSESHILWDTFCKMNFENYINSEIKKSEHMVKAYGNHSVCQGDFFLIHQIEKYKLKMLLELKSSLIPPVH